LLLGLSIVETCSYREARRSKGFNSFTFEKQVVLGAMKDAYSLCNTVLKAMLLFIVGIENLPEACIFSMNYFQIYDLRIM